MSLAITIESHWAETRLYVIGTITPSGNYVTGGDTIDFGLYPIKAARAPIIVLFNSKNGYGYTYIPGTNINDGKLRVNTTAATELAQAAYPAGVTGDVIRFLAIFHKLV